jgi:hypothetical protein
MWNPEEQKQRIKPAADKFIKYLAKIGIQFIPRCTPFRNVRFIYKDKGIEMSEHSFYRYSGIYCTYKEGEKPNTIEVVPVSDERYYSQFMLVIIKKRLGIDN